MKDHYLTVNFDSGIHPETEIIDVRVSLTLKNIHTDEETDIGDALLYFINTFRSNSWIDVIEQADVISGDLLTVISGLKQVLEEEEEYFGQLVVLDSILIKNEYRNKGYGEEAMVEILRYLELLSFDYIALLAYPFEEKDKDNQLNQIKRLIRFYEQLGMNVVKDDKVTETIMGMNLNHI